MKMRHDWKKIVRHAWSVRLLGAAFAFTGAEAALPYVRLVLPSAPPLFFLALSAVCTGGAFVARLLAQSQFGGDD